MLAWMAWVERWTPGLTLQVGVYPGGHGFIFGVGSGVELAREEKGGVLGLGGKIQYVR